MLEVRWEGFVVELLAEDGPTTLAVAVSEITTLDLKRRTQSNPNRCQLSSGSAQLSSDAQWIGSRSCTDHEIFDDSMKVRSFEMHGLATGC